jgi:integrase
MGPWYRKQKRSWYAWVNGQQVSLKVRGRRNAKAARAAWHRLRAGEQRPSESAGRLTVRELIRRYLAGCRDRVKPKTLRGYSDFLLPFARRHGRMPAASLTPETAERYSRRPSWSATTRHGFLGTLLTAFRWAAGRRAKLLASNPLDGVCRPPKASRGESALISPDDHQRLLTAATPQFRLFLAVLYATGARPGEVAAISAANFSPDAGTMQLTAHKTAHLGKCRTIYLPADVGELLRGLRQRYPSGPLLRNRSGRAWTEWAVVKAMEATRQRAGLPRAISYGYRHSFITDALASGLNDSLVAELAGHSGTAMLANYRHLAARQKALRDALDRVRRG